MPNARHRLLGDGPHLSLRQVTSPIARPSVSSTRVCPIRGELARLRRGGGGVAGRVRQGRASSRASCVVQPVHGPSSSAPSRVCREAGQVAAERRRRSRVHRRPSRNLARSRRFGDLSHGRSAVDGRAVEQQGCAVGRPGRQFARFTKPVSRPYQPVEERHLGRRRGDRERHSSDDLDSNAVGVRGERFDIGVVPCQHRPARFCEHDDESVHRRAGSCETSELRGPSCRRFAHGGFDDACLQEPIGVGVASWIALQRLDEHDRWHDGWPEVVLDE